jgi:ankyrin repeat protein/tetratricopeptide (TPR) repeat protein
MTMKKKYSLKRMLLMMVVLIMVSFSGCGPKETAVDTEPKRPTFSQQEYLELIRKGDENFSLMHLYGWRKAGNFYAEAYRLKPEPELREKLFLTLFLSALREKQEGIVNPGIFQKIKDLGEFPENQKLYYLSEIAQHLQTLPVFRKNFLDLEAVEKKEVDVTLFDLENSPLDLYLYFYCLDYYRFNMKHYSTEMVSLLKKHQVLERIRKNSDNPLFIYFNPQVAINKEAEIEARYPGFAEFFVQRGNVLFSRNKLKQAGEYFKKALELIPDHTKALTGMGNIYYFKVKDYFTAVNYYDKALELDKTNPTALFGKGVSLHHLEEYDRSDEVLDFMLQNQPEHHGEAYYFKAYNRFQMKEPEKARLLVEQSKKRLPHKGEVLFLSGLLYYNEGKWNEAEKDFSRTLYDREYSPCYPLYYLGILKAKKQDWGFFRDFNDSIRNFESLGRALENKLAKIDSMDLNQHQKNWMKQRQTVRLQEFRKDSSKVIAQMRTIMEKNKSRREAHVKNVSDRYLQQLKQLLEQDPSRLNAPDSGDDGSTLLHKAVVKGHRKAVEYLLSRGADIDIPDKNNYTPLSWAVLLKNMELIRILTAQGANLNHKGPNGLTPLHDAVYNGETQIAEFLIAEGARLDARNDSGQTPLELAVWRKNKRLLKLLKPLHDAVKEGNTVELKKLVKKYPGLLNALDENGCTPLHCCALTGKIEPAEILLAAGAQLDFRNRDGSTALELARKTARHRFEDWLLARGAAPTDNEMLAKDLADREAVLWYLNGHGWGIKTKNSFLLFDYPIYQGLFIARYPQTARLGTGKLNPEELKDQRVIAFTSYQTMVTGKRRKSPLYRLENKIENIIYVSMQQVKEAPNYIVIGPWETKRIDGIEISTVQASADGTQLGFLVKVDGLTIFYSGSHGCWRKNLWEPFKKGIDYIVKNSGNGIDLQFLPILSSINIMTQEEREYFARGLRYAVKMLKPKVFVPLVNLGDEIVSKRFANEAVRKGIVNGEGTKIISPNIKGDRFFYKNGRI